MNKPKIAILILGYNSIAYLPKLFKCLEKQTYDEFEICYIDNASIDGSLAYVKNECKNVNIIQHKINYGYAGGYGREMKKFFKECDFDSVVLINPDTTLSKTWLYELVKSAYKKEKIGFVQSLIFLANESEQRINSSGNMVYMAGFGLLDNCGEIYDENKFRYDRPCAYASGCSLLVKREVFEDGISFDEDFFLYYEDQDICWRGRMYGYESIVSVKSHVWHDYEYPQTYKWKKKFFYLERNRWFFILKNFESKTIILLSPYLLMWEIIIVFHSLNKGYFFQKIHANSSVILSLISIYKKRRKIQLERIKTDKELWKYINYSIEYTEVPNLYKKIVNYISLVYYKYIVKFL